MTWEEIIADEGYHPYGETVQRLREEGWEYVKDLNVACDKDFVIAITSCSLATN
jgi:hypothetical protein